jgi:hypothetical protein
MRTRTYNFTTPRAARTLPHSYDWQEGALGKEKGFSNLEVLWFGLKSAAIAVGAVVAIWGWYLLVNAARWAW